MKKYITGFNLFLGFCSLVLFSSCTKDFDELNTDKTRIEVLSPNQLDKLFSTAEYAGITNTDQWAGGYQLLTSLASDEQAQFFSCTQAAFPSDRNAMVGRWINRRMGSFPDRSNNAVRDPCPNRTYIFRTRSFEGSGSQSMESIYLYADD